MTVEELISYLEDFADQKAEVLICAPKSGNHIYIDNLNLSCPNPYIEINDTLEDKDIVAKLQARIDSLRSALEKLISTLKPAVNYTGVQVVWSAQDRAWTKEAIKEAEKLLEEI